MKSLPLFDLIVLLIYLLIMLGTGAFFGLKKRDPAQFTKAGGRLPYWAVGLSVFGTFLSSNTFIGVTGKAYGTDWNYFLFSLTLPFAAWIASRYFVPFYRNNGFVSAYEHMEYRFGLWARMYMVAGYLLTQLARVGSIMFGVALVFQALLDIELVYTILALGILVTAYTMLGGIEAVIWTDVVQSIILTLGAGLILILILKDIPGGAVTIVREGMTAGKFSLGDFQPDLTRSTIWVVLLYGVFVNLNNFGIDQSFIQRYHAARNTRDASRSLWLSVRLYIPVSLFFFFIGTGLWVYYQHHSGELEPVRERVLQEWNRNAGEKKNAPRQEKLTDSDLGDRVLPEFMVTKVPPGLTGLLIAALFAAAMSSIDTSLNSSATVIWSDIYRRYINKEPADKISMRVLHMATLLWGITGTAVALALLGIRSVLDTWWTLSGVMAGGMLGLFLLGLIGRRTGSRTAAVAVVIGIMLIAWMSLSVWIPPSYYYLKNALDTNMTVVIGTLSIFLSGIIISRIKRLK